MTRPPAGRCLAEAAAKPWFELPLFTHDLKQTIARINLVAAVMPELELPPADKPFVTAFLARAFAGLTLAKEAQATPLRDIFPDFYGRDRLEWLDELAPQTVPWHDGRKLKLLYPEEAARRGRPTELPGSASQTARMFRLEGASADLRGKSARQTLALHARRQAARLHL